MLLTGIRMVAAFFCLNLFIIFCYAGPDSNSVRPFSNKVVFSETPEIGKKWHGGIRMNDIAIWDGYWNVNNILLVDFLFAGFNSLKVDQSMELVDKFRTLTIKSRPLELDLRGNTYRIAVGLKVFKSDFSMKDLEANDDVITISDRSTVLFLTQSLVPAKNHSLNLFASLSNRKNGFDTYYIIPGYSWFFSKNWSLDFEYYMTNSLRLPIKILQFAFDSDKLDFFNSERAMYSFMIYGASFTGKHLRVDLHLSNHISFAGPIIPILGVGWNF